MYIERKEYLDKLVRLKDKDIVKVITGIRRCGKSVLLNEIYYDYLLNTGIDTNHIIKIGLDQNRWVKYRKSEKLYEYIKSIIVDEKKYYILLDEIQLVKHFEEVVNGLKAEFNVDIYLTGSNSEMLSYDINTIFRGRSIEIKVFPFSFQEFYSYKNQDKQDAFNEYVLYGGLPYISTLDTEADKIDYLKMICDTVVTRDVIERYNIRNRQLFISVLELLFSSIGSLVCANSIANTLKSNGFKSVDNETVSRYLECICNAFLVYKVTRFDVRGKEYLKTQNKYYVVDMGIRNAKLNYRQIEMTHIIENIVYLELIRRGYTVDIGKNDDKEIDFVARDREGIIKYIQVSLTIENEDTKNRELNAFKGLDDGYSRIIITMDNNPLNNLKDGVRKVNLYDFLLSDF